MNDDESRSTGFFDRTLVYFSFREPDSPERPVKQSWPRPVLNIFVLAALVTLFYVFAGPSWGGGALAGALVSILTPWFRRSVLPRYDRWEARRGRSEDHSSG